VRRAPAKIAMDEILINGSISGRWNTSLAKKLAEKKKMRNRSMPMADSNIIPQASTLFISAVLFSDLYWARCLIIAGFIPQSLNTMMRIEGIMATVYMPYWAGCNSRTIIIVPTADITLETETPRNVCSPPLAVSFAILITFVVEFWRCLRTHIV